MCFITCLTAQQAQTVPVNNFLVHITGFLDKRADNYFSNLDGVSMKLDSKGIWHYYKGSYSTLEEADSVKRTLIQKGYPYAYVVDVQKVRRECKLSCDSDPSIDPTMPTIIRQIRSLHHLLFDFNKSALNNDAKTQLNNLSTILTNNSAYHVEFKGHADAIGSADYNKALSERRSEAAKTYIEMRGVAKNHVKTSSYGMEVPIAKNAINGKDCPTGRKFNRRVEIFITDIDGNIINTLIEPFDIPTDLLADLGSVKLK